jgi:zinc/manganese transport system permease protein
VYLVFTTLIVPALATYRHPVGRQLVVGYGLAMASYVIGLAASAILDLPASPVIVWAMFALGVIVHLTSPAPAAALEARANGQRAELHR